MRHALCILIATVTLAGCDGAAWHDVADGETAVITPSAPGFSESDAKWWSVIVESAVVTWNERLESAGCRVPFTVGAGGHAVTLRHSETWTADTCATTYDGRDLGGYVEHIEVQSGECASVPTVIHELGHAMGVEHPDDDMMPVLMNPWPSRQPFELTEWDVAAAVSALGC